MPVLSTQLTSGVDNVDDADSVTASITPTANALVLAVVASASAVDPPEPTLSGNGLTWVSVATLMDVDTDTRITLFRAMGAAPSAGAVTITWSQTQVVKLWSIAEFTNVDTGGANGSAAVVQSATNFAAAATSLIVTLAAFGSVDNATFGGFSYVEAASQTVGAGFTKLGETTTGDFDYNLMTEWKDVNDTTVDESGPGSVFRSGIAVEIKFAAAAVAFVPNTSMHLMGVGH